MTTRQGLTLIETMVSLAILVLLCGLVLSGIQTGRAAASRRSCANQLRQLVLACHYYHSQHLMFPIGHRSESPEEHFPNMS
jgi:type II secretory pathway pseudopilin PulG